MVGTGLGAFVDQGQYVSPSPTDHVQIPGRHREGGRDRKTHVMLCRSEIPREAVAITMRAAGRSQGGGRLDGGQSGHVFAGGLWGLCTWKLGRAAAAVGGREGGDRARQVGSSCR